ncbi:MAG: hypothetical protein GY701_09740 [Sulfitobacter sp.]|nr:hypothetical protein [Sulfitobacter sp.]MCP4103443.1 hypothetical protein [Lentisphaerota bacterium]
MFARNGRWRSGARAADAYAWVGFALFCTIWGVGFLIAAAIHRDPLELLVAGLFTLIGVGQIVGSLWLLSRNYVAFDDAARQVLVNTSGDKIRVSFDDALFIVPARRSFLPAYVQLEQPAGGRIRCGLMSQGRLWNSVNLRGFKTALTQRGIHHRAEP